MELSPTDVVREIIRLKKEKNAVLLVHNYQRSELWDIADFVGDSLELSLKAKDTSADIIVFCGVDFMAETAKILNPTKLVLHPTPSATCPLAAMVDVAAVRAARTQYPSYPLVAYVNTPAAIKAEADVCCTSANAVEVCNALSEKELLFVPDKNLAAYVAKKTGKTIVPLPGHCYVHNSISVDTIRFLKKEHPHAKVIAHPECPLDVLDVADAVTSTSGMVHAVERLGADEYILATECSMKERLSRIFPHKTFYNAGGICAQMKQITLYDVYNSLRGEKYAVFIDADIASRARSSLERMFSLTRGTSRN